MSAKAVDADDSACESCDRARVGNNNVDRQLHFYLTSSHYDCTFSASAPEEGLCAKIFKCHRFVLAAASTVFEKMLFGNFKEANQGRDDEIKIEVSPTVFDLAMRFIYGSQRDFKSCELAVEIYYFANKWMIEALVQAAGEFLIKQLSLDDALLVYEMCIDLNISLTSELRKCCYSVIRDKTVQVHTSKQWLAASRRTISTIYCLHRLSVGEAYLLKMLVLWGEARCSSDQSTDLRAQIDPMLRNIRFRSMSCQDFLAISKECDVLTTEEKLQIMESLSVSDSNRMPPAFSLKGYPRNLSNSQMVDWSSVGRLNDKRGENECTRFSFYVDKNGIFLNGLYLHSVDEADKNDTVFSITCSIRKGESGMKLGTAKLDAGVRKKVVEKRRCIAFDEPVALAKDFLYCIEIKFNSGQWSPPSFMNIDRKFMVCAGLCSIFFHPATKVRDVCGFELSKIR